MKIQNFIRIRLLNYELCNAKTFLPNKGNASSDELLFI